MELNYLSNSINKYLYEELDMVKVNDKELKAIGDGYYFIDKSRAKYLICYTVFKDVSDLIKNWEVYQNEYIASNLQMKKYNKSDIRWDIYYILIYNDKNYIDPEVELSIERDSFCCKKLCINGFDKDELIENLRCKLPIGKESYKFKESNIASYEEFIMMLCDNLKIKIDEKLIEDEIDFEGVKLAIDNILEIMREKDNE